MQQKRKIALVGYSFSTGGAERVLSNLSFVFDRLGYEVHTIIMIDKVSYPYAGKFYNIGALRNSSNSFFNKINRFWMLRKYIREQQFDAIIDFRFRVNDFQELIIYKFAYKAPVLIQTVHLGDFKSYLFDKKWLSRLVFKSFDSIVCISEKQQEAIQQELEFNNLSLIHNSIDIQQIQQLKNEVVAIQHNYIIAVGRFFEVKQFDQLIEAYSKTKLVDDSIHLIILGEGPEKEKLQNTIDTLHLSDKVHLMDFQENPYKYMARALFLVNSSLMEGLPMVLLESLACETPIIAFDCPTGPSEIIVNDKNGILVDNQNFEALIDAMNTLNSDVDLYNRCKSYALESVAKFDVSVIEKKWQVLLDELLTKKGR